MRLQKFLAEGGIASRRASEQVILAGRVRVNGQPVQVLGVRVDPDHERITVDGKLVRPKQKRYIALNKPPGCVCSHRDPQGRRTVSDFLPKEWNDLFSVGRLDWDSEGLILLTNDGRFCLRLTHPRYGVRKTYRVTVAGRVENATLSRFMHGVMHHGECLRAEKARLMHSNNTQSLAELELSEGKNREARRLFESQGLQVSRLQRIQIGCVKLGELPPGKWRTLTKSEIKSLLPEL